jgi:sodium/bile acid cotransporter 7
MCSATASSLLGVFLTPLIAGFLLTRHGLDISAHSVLAIVEQLLLPFVAGRLLRPWIDAYLTRHPRALKGVDYGSILILVYTAFSHGVVDGIWHQIDMGDLFKVVLVDVTLLAAVMAILTFASRQLGFSRADEITIVFCGSKKKPRQRRANCNVAVRRARWARYHTIDGVPSDPTHGLRVARAALRSAPGHGE